MNQTVSPARAVRGKAILPADKSIAHRAAMLAALGDGESQLVNYPASADPLSTLSCVRQVGISVEDRDGILYVQGKGLEGLQQTAEPLDCGNSGTTMRLLSGILSGQSFDTTLIGDASLTRRPMGRVADPLRTMGARIDLTEGHAPVYIKGGQTLRGIEYPLPVPSAQVKSCVLLAGLYAEGETTVIESIPSRDHTERMLGLDAFESGGKRYLSVRKGHRIPARTWTIPRDFSAAAFFLVAGSILEEGELYLPGVGINPTRSALLNVLRAMGADIQVQNERVYGGEPIADLRVRPAQLHGVTVSGDLIPNLIDEIPILAVAGACAQGRTEIRDAAELRVKETDRIAAIAEGLTTMGAHVEVFEDGLAVEGPAKLHGATINTYDDHRIAMAMGVAGLVASGTTTITHAECAAVSFPDFWQQLEAVVL